MAQQIQGKKMKILDNNELILFSSLLQKPSLFSGPYPNPRELKSGQLLLSPHQNWL